MALNEALKKLEGYKAAKATTTAPAVTPSATPPAKASTGTGLSAAMAKLESYKSKATTTAPVNSSVDKAVEKVINDTNVNKKSPADLLTSLKRRIGIQSSSESVLNDISSGVNKGIDMLAETPLIKGAAAGYEAIDQGKAPMGFEQVGLKFLKAGSPVDKKTKSDLEKETSLSEPINLNKEGKNFFDKIKEIAAEPTKLVPFAASAQSISDANDLRNAIINLESNKGETNEEQRQLLLLKNFIEENNRDNSFGYTVADIISNLPAFAGELVYTSGGAFATRKSTEKGIKELIESVLSKQGGKILENKLAKFGLKTVGTIAGEAVRLPIASAGRITADAIQENVPEFQLTRDEAGKLGGIITGEAPGWAQAIKNATVNSFIENVSERSGGALSGLTNVAKDRLLKLSIFNSLKRLNPNLNVKAFEEILNKAGWNGVIGEMFEERVGDVMRGVATEAGLSNAGWKVPTKDDLAVEFVSFLLPGAAINATRYGLGKINTSILTKQQDDAKNALQNDVRRSVATDGKEAVKTALVGEGFTPEQADAFIAKSIEVDPTVSSAIEEAKNEVLGITPKAEQAKTPEDFDKSLSEFAATEGIDSSVVNAIKEAKMSSKKEAPTKYTYENVLDQVSNNNTVGQQASYDKAIEAGDYKAEDIYQDVEKKILTKDRADAMISDVAGNLERYTAGFGAKFQKLIGDKPVTASEIKEMAISVLEGEKIPNKKDKNINYPNNNPEKGVKIYGSIKGDTATLESIEISKAKQKSGLGTKYVQQFEDWAKENGASTIKIEAYKKSIKFWEKKGFKLDKEFPVIDGIKQDFLPGTKELSKQAPTKQDTEVLTEKENGKNIEAVKNIYKEAGEDQANEALGEVLMSLELAEKGSRSMIENQKGPGFVFSAIRSTFPAWIPENMRSRKAIDTLLSNIQSIDTIKYPTKKNASAQRAFVDAVLDQVDKRLGVDTSEIRNNILSQYNEQKTKDIPQAESIEGDSRDLTDEQIADLFAEDMKFSLKEQSNLTTKILKDLEGKTTVSKQYILDATNRAELKQVERDMTRRVLEDMTMSDGSLSSIDEIKSKYPKLEFGIYENSSEITLSKIVVPKDERGRGTGTSAMNDLIKYADKNGKKIVLTPSTDYGGSSVSRLKDFYKKFGFVENSGKNKDFSTRESMFRLPQKTSSSNTINVNEFTDRIKTELLPLKVRDDLASKEIALAKLEEAGYTVEQDMSGAANVLDKDGEIAEYDELPVRIQRLIDSIIGNADTFDEIGKPKYEKISLPSDIRGDIKSYKENIYESPIKTSAGSIHFSGKTDNYFGHTRVEDMADNETRRIIEVQSDLYQKGKLERELDEYKQSKDTIVKIDEDIARINKRADKLEADGFDAMADNERAGISSLQNEKNRRAKIVVEEESKLKLQPYRNTFHERLIREEVARAANDGITKLQFPTGETAMKIEGLGENINWFDNDKYESLLRNGLPEGMGGMQAMRTMANLNTESLSIGKVIKQGIEGRNWIVTEVLEAGKFKAVPSNKVFAKADYLSKDFGYKELGDKVYKSTDVEQFDISGKVDTNNPIYKYYESTVTKFLKSNFKGEKVTDAQGVTWIEINPTLFVNEVVAFNRKVNIRTLEKAVDVAWENEMNNILTKEEIEAVVLYRSGETSEDIENNIQSALIKYREFEKKFLAENTKLSVEAADANVPFDLTTQQAQDIIRKIFKEKELDILFNQGEIVMKRDGKEITAWGAFYPGRAWKNPLIAMAQNGGKVQSHVLYHEMFHAYLNMFVSNEEKATVLKNVTNNPLTKPTRLLTKKVGYTDAELSEEWLADDFAAYVQSVMSGSKDVSAKENKSFYKKVLEMIKSWIRKITQAQNIYDRILAGERPEFANTPARVSVSDMYKIKESERIMDEGFNEEVAEVAADTKIGQEMNLFGEKTSQFTIAPEKRSEQFRRKVQDLNGRIDVVQNQLREQGARINNESDVFLAKTLLPRRIGAAMKRFEDKVRDPFISALVRNGISIEEFDSYLHARHAPERNERMKQKGYQGETGSGMSNEESAQILEKFKSEGKLDILDSFQERVQSINNLTISMLVTNGMMSAEEAQNIKDTGYKYYVPLGRDMGYEGSVGTGRGIDIRGKDIKRAKGSEREVLPLLAQVFHQFEKATVRVEKNRVAQTLKKQIAENPALLDNLFELRSQKWIPRYNEDGEIEYMDPVMERDPRTIGVREGGKQYYIVIKDDLMARAMKDLGKTNSIPLLRTPIAILSALTTRYSPEFIPRNFQRDVGEAMINLSGIKELNLDEKQRKAFRREVLKNIPSLIKGIFQGERGTTSQWSGVIDDFRREGGETGSFHLENPKSAQKQLQRLESKYKNQGFKQKLINKTMSALEFIDDVNTAVELGVRISTYNSLVQRGVDKKKAADIAGDLTVDFNKSGEWGGVLKSIYLFINPAIQGTARAIKGLRYSKKVRQAAAAMVIGGFVNGVISMLIGGDDDDDIPQYVKNTGIVFADGKGGQVKIWNLPYGFNVFWALGRNMAEYSMDRKDFADSVRDTLIAGLDSFNPLGGSKISFTNLFPTIIKPLAEIDVNEAWHGGPVYPTQTPFTPAIPDSENYWRSTSNTSIWITQFLNKMTGGSDKKSGYIDISPATLDYGIAQYTGGLGNFVRNTFDFGATVVTGGDLKPENIPFVRDVFRTINKKQAAQGIVYPMIENSSLKSYNERDTAKFNKSVDKLVTEGAIDMKKAEEFKQAFKENQFEVNTGQEYDVSQYQEGIKNIKSGKSRSVVAKEIATSIYGEDPSKQSISIVEKNLKIYKSFGFDDKNIEPFMKGGSVEAKITRLQEIKKAMPEGKFKEFYNQAKNTELLSDAVVKGFEKVKNQPITAVASDKKFKDDEKTSEKGILNTVATYAKAIGVDPTTAFNRIFSGQKIRRIDNGTIIVERMSLEDSQNVKKERGGNTKEMKLDHRISLSLGGSNSEDNLILVTTEEWEKYTPVENYLGSLLRNEKISKKDAQTAIADFKDGKITFDEIKAKFKND